MTFREAVEIIDTPTCMNDESIARYTRARAIVDAAVEAHEARCTSYDDGGGFDRKLANASMAKFNKLRALERGEEIQ